MIILTGYNGPMTYGAGKRLVEFIEEALARDNRVIFLGTDRSQAPNGCDFIEFDPPRRFPKSLRTKKAMLPALNLAYEKFKPDIILAWGLAMASGLFQLKHMERIPMVLFLRALELRSSLREHFLKPLRYTSIAAYPFYKKIFAKWANTVIDESSLIIFQSDEQRREFATLGMQVSDHLHEVKIVPNNCNPSWVPQSCFNTYAGDKKAVALTGSRLAWENGFRQAFAAFKRVKQQVPDAEFWIAGEGMSPLRAEVLRAGQKIPGVRFLGHRKDMLRLLRDARFLLYPAVDCFGYPNIVLEASAVGTPLILSDTASCVPISHEGMYAKFDVERLTELWLKILIDDNFWEKLRLESKNLREKTSFDWAGCCLKVLNDTATKRSNN